MPDIASDLNGLGMARLTQGDSRTADTLFRAALSLCERNSQKADTAHVCAHSLNNLGLAQLQEHDLPAAETTLARTLALARQVAGPVHPAVGVVVGELGDVRWAKGDLDGAERFYRESLEIFKQLGPRDYPERASSLGGLALVLETRGRYTEAVSLLQEENRVIERTEGPTHPDVGLNWVHLGGVHRQMGNLALAKAETERGMAIYEGRLLPTDLYYTKILTYVALVKLATGEAERAKALLDTAVRVARARYGGDDPRICEAESAMGKTLVALGRSSEAVPMLAGCVAAFGRTIGVRHPWTVSAAEDLAVARSAQRKR